MSTSHPNVVPLPNVPQEGRQIDASLVIERYQQLLSAASHQSIVAQAHAAAAEAEAAQLRVMVAELQAQLDAPQPEEPAAQSRR